MQLGLHFAVRIQFRPVRISCMVQMPRLNIAGKGAMALHGPWHFPVLERRDRLFCDNGRQLPLELRSRGRGVGGARVA